MIKSYTKPLLLLLAFVLLLPVIFFGQVTKAKYYLTYEESLKSYTCHMVVTQGNASLANQRQMGKSKVSIATYGYQITNIKSRAPYVDGLGSAMEPIQWVINDTTSVNSGYISFVPFNGVSYFDTLAVNDTIALFSFQTFPVDTCGTEIRLFNNPTDLYPNSSITLALVENFKNIISIGTASNLYDGNIISPNRPKINGSGLACIGDVITLTPPNLPGTWSNPPSGLATLSGNALTITGAGTIQLTYNANTDECRYTLAPIVSNFTPSIDIPSNNICLGSSIQISPSLPGVWTSSNPSVLTVNSTGKATAVGTGMAKITYINPTTGCISAPTPDITVAAGPVITFNGPKSICVGNTTSLSPTSGGTWSVQNTSVGSITNGGIFTGISSGNTYAIFTSSNNSCQAFSDTIKVSTGATITFSGPTTICAGQTLLAIANGSGVWSVTNPSIAGIDQTGRITAIAPGATTIKLTNSIGCVSESSQPIVVVAAPVLSGGPIDLCIGETTIISAPSTSGQWISSNPLVATIHPTSGLVTALSAGETQITITNITGCLSNPLTIIVNPNPMIHDTINTVCIGGTIQLFANGTGGSWFSNNQSIATVNSNGIITGVSQGMTSVVYTSSEGCKSNPYNINVTSNAQVTFIGPSTICVGSQTQMAPNPSNGTWSSSNPNVASVNNNGLVVGIAPGSVTISYLPSTGGCTYLPSPALVVIGNNIVLPDTIKLCRNSSFSLNPPVTGTWTSENTNIATVTSPNGVITGHNVGITKVSVANSSGCIKSVVVKVIAEPSYIIPNKLTQCVGDTIEFQPSGSGVVWTSNNTNIARVVGGNKIVGVASGPASFTLTVNNQSCSTTTPVFTFRNAPQVSVQGGVSSICVGSMAQLIPSSGGTWSFAAPTVATVTSSGQVTALAPGIAAFQFMDTIGCESELLMLTVNPSPTITNAYNPKYCVGNTLTMQSNVDGQWASSNPNIATIDANGLANFLGSGTIRFSITTAQNCRTNTTEIIVNPKPTISISGPNAVCPNSMVTLTATGGSSYVWSNSQTTNSATFAVGNSILIAEVTVTDDQTCSNTAQKIIELLPTPTISFTGSNVVCMGGKVNITALGGINYQWSNGANVPTINVGAGVYLVTVTGSNNCSSTGSITVEELAPPKAEIIGPSMVCPGSCTLLTALGGVSYLWTSGSTQPNNCVIAGPTSVTVTDINGCTATASTTITLLPQPTIGISSNTIVVGMQVVLNSNSAGTWMSANTTIASIVDNQRVLGNSEGMADLIFTDAVTGCADTIKITVLKSSSTDNNNDIKIKIYPNPSQEKVFISCSEQIIDAKLMDNHGHIIMSSISSEESIAHLSQGIYVVKIKTKKGESYHKIIKI
jgi:uncharacterized protein YjdB